MRFDFGTVGNLVEPDQSARYVTDIDAHEAIQFRVKIVDESSPPYGRILGIADQIAPSESKSAQTNKRSILPVEPKLLGSLVWRLDFDSDRPVLEVNCDIPNVMDIAKKDDCFFALVYPAVVQQILSRVLLKERHSEIDDDLDDWKNMWLKFALQQNAPSLPDLPSSPEDEEYVQSASEWIEEAVKAFCRGNNVSERFRHALTGENYE
jgi:hypothetical protein